MSILIVIVITHTPAYLPVCYLRSRKRKGFRRENHLTTNNFWNTRNILDIDGIVV